MENRYFSNNATTTVSSLSGTTLVVASAAKFPSQYPYFLTLETAGLTREIVKVTASPSANTLTIVRAQEGTIQSTFSAGDKVEIRITAGTLNGLNDKAERSGDTFTGNVKVQTSGSVGSSSLRSGTNGTTGGQLHFADSANTSQMFMGGTSSGGFITAQTNAATATLTINVPTNAVSGDQFSLLTQADGKTRVKMGNDFVPRCLSSGQPLPSTNIGPIWHDDYHEWMIWQNLAVGTGAEYNGYASKNIGEFKLDTEWRDGYMPQGYNISKTTYAALWAWAVQNNFVVNPSGYHRGNYSFFDNGDNTFRIPTLGGYFQRIWDDDSVIDYMREPFMKQAGQFPAHHHLVSTQAGTNNGANIALTDRGVYDYNNPRNTSTVGGTENSSENRPINTAFYGMVKF